MVNITIITIMIIIIIIIIMNIYSTPNLTYKVFFTPQIFILFNPKMLPIKN